MPAQPAAQIWPDHVEVTLDDGQVAALRPLRPRETEPLLEVFAGMSALSRARRYLTGMPYLPDRVLQQLTDVGRRDHVAWLATIDGEPVGIGRYAAYDHRTVDVALEVVDHWHGQGLGVCCWTRSRPWPSPTASRPSLPPWTRRTTPRCDSCAGSA